MSTATVRRPSLIDYLSEGHRAGIDYAGFVAGRDMVALGRLGAGRHVLVIPGLMADDRSTAPLRRLLADVGYRPHAWRLGRNVGPTGPVIDGILRRTEELAERNGEKISVIGWSLGGLFAREVANLRPEVVDRVITLGSPLSITDRMQSRASAVYDLFAHRHLADYGFDEWAARRRMPDVPFTSVYTRTDGIVHHRSCLVPDGPTSENVEVYGSHCGLGANLAAAYVVLDRLEEPVDAWRPFRAPAYLRGAFPRNRGARDAA
ncbi:triacylglycerol lipase [Tsukamurella sp. 1534]|uniref:esterase/lipase family protein n=1 Tax=Tsukamurella sp. 1534 TaxID=1151061 RepID=UPI0002DD3D03|nr:alpha/beta hydrolase [Tsukamurella sp. 1534]